jgi:hypothetical protein
LDVLLLHHLLHFGNRPLGILDSVFDQLMRVAFVRSVAAAC